MMERERREWTLEMGEDLRDWREAQGMSQRELAAKLGAGKNQPHRWETGMYGPNLMSLRKLSEMGWINRRRIMSGGGYGVVSAALTRAMQASGHDAYTAARIIGVSPSTIYNWIKGARGITSTNLAALQDYITACSQAAADAQGDDPQQSLNDVKPEASGPGSGRSRHAVQDLLRLAQSAAEDVSEAKAAVSQAEEVLRDAREEMSEAQGFLDEVLAQLAAAIKNNGGER